MKTPSLVRISLLLVSSGSALLAADVIDDSLRMRFNFDAAPVGNVIVDSSPSATHPGTNQGAIWIPTEIGRTGVMNFSAPISDAVTVPPIPALNSTTGTISFWIKTSGNLVRGDYAAMLMDRRTSSGDVITLTDAGTLFVQARKDWANANVLSGAAVINDNQWHHVAYVYDQSEGGSISLYVDGVLDASQLNSMAWSWPDAQPLQFGSSPDSYWRVFVGLMDDVQIHNRMLSGAEIAATFAGSPVLDSSLVERLDFTAAPTNNVVLDTSSSGNFATNQGAVWVSADAGRSGLMRFDLAIMQITVAPHLDFDSPTGTIAFWMRSTGTRGPGEFASILFDRRAAGNGDVIAMKDDGTIFVQALGNGQAANSFSTVGRVNDGQWHHIAYVYDQSAQGSIRIYIDGTSSGFQTNSIEWYWPTEQPLELGLSHDGYWFGFDGSLDEVRFYNRQLSATEIGQIGVPPRLRFELQPESQSVFVGDDVTLSALANMEASYQWRLNGTNLPGASTNIFMITNVQALNAGSYTLVASNPTFGTVTSTPAILIVDPRPSLPASLVARYNFDATPVSDVIVDTAPGAEHPGTNNLAVWSSSVSGRSGVMQFSASDTGSQIVIPAHPEFNSSKGTIAFWMKSPGNDLSFGDYAAIIFDRRTDDGDVITMVDDGTLFVQAYNTWFRANTFATANTVNDDAWHHVAYIYDQGPNGSTRIYVDGQLAGANPNASIWMWDPKQPIELGRSHDTYWRRFQGFLDDVQFYNRTLSPAEVAQSMTLNIGPSLAIMRVGTQISISWSQAGFKLQETSNIGSPSWTDVSGGTTSPVSITVPTSGTRFYRLHNL